MTANFKLGILLTVAGVLLGGKPERVGQDAECRERGRDSDPFQFRHGCLRVDGPDILYDQNRGHNTMPLRPHVPRKPEKRPVSPI